MFWGCGPARLRRVRGRERFEPGSVEYEARARVARRIIAAVWLGDFGIATAVAVIVGIETGSAGWAIVSVALSGAALVLIGAAVFLTLPSGRDWLQGRRHPRHP